MTTPWTVAAAAATLALVVWLVMRARVGRINTALAEREAQLGEATARAEALARYSVIPDAEAHAAQLVREAEGRVRGMEDVARDAATRAAHAASAAEQEAKVTVEAARQRAELEASEMRQAARARLEAAEAKIADAHAQATRIIEDAQKRAEEVAGEALEAKRDSDRYARAAEAMKNVIEGYGDRYIIPTFSVLDSLAEEFGFDQAGQKLKEARANTRSMIEAGRAATCDYVEENRRRTAIEFVLDAFNGKADTALAGVKRDNFGTLSQKFKDAFALVNNNGAAFRSARITEEYLNARLDELRWAVAVQELREKEKEEQRELRERIREEEKAQREYERAMKEAAKEEETLLKLQAKVQAEFDKASDEQKAKYEKQLQEVNERLRLAEEKNQRALSMAQQTRAGHVYVISNEGSFGENVLKIGLTRRLEPQDRIRELGDASVPFEFDVHALIRSDDAPTLERALHKKFVEGQVNKVNPRKEFFRTTVEEVRKEVEKLGLQASWTLAAAAREYRETQAIEKAMREKKFDTKDWATKQVEEHDVSMATAVAAEAEPA